MAHSFSPGQQHKSKTRRQGSSAFADEAGRGSQSYEFDMSAATAAPELTSCP